MSANLQNMNVNKNSRKRKFTEFNLDNEKFIDKEILEFKSKKQKNLSNKNSKTLIKTPNINTISSNKSKLNVHIHSLNLDLNKKSNNFSKESKKFGSFSTLTDSNNSIKNNLTKSQTIQNKFGFSSEFKLEEKMGSARSIYKEGNGALICSRSTRQ